MTTLDVCSRQGFPGFFCYLTVLVVSVLLGQRLLAQEGTLKWTFKTNSSVDSSPAIGDDGIIYAGSADDNLYAIEPDGTEKWRFDAGTNIARAPVIADDGTIYAANISGVLFAVNPDGSMKWTFTPAAAGAASEMALAADGTIYYAVLQTLYAVNPNGSQFWTALGDKGIIEAVSIGLSGSVLAMLSNGLVFAFNPQGAQQWQFSSTRGIEAPAGFAEDGTIYFGNFNETNNLFALNPDGTVKWQATGDAQVNAGPSTAANGDVYYPVNFKRTQGQNRGFVISTDPADGSENWRYETDGGVGTTPAVGFDNTIYFGSTANKLTALRSDGSEKWVYSSPFAGQINSSPTIAPNGTIYFGSTDTRLYAVSGVSPGLAASSWAKFQRDAHNTGQFGSDVTRWRRFAPHVYWLDEESNAVVTISHTGSSLAKSGGTLEASPAGPAGPTASFRIDVLNRNGSVRFSLDGSVESGETTSIVLRDPAGGRYDGAVVIDAPIKDGSFLAPHLTWILNVSNKLEPLHIGVFFEGEEDAAQSHHMPAEASETNGLGIGVQNIGPNQISCSLEFFNSDGSTAGEVQIPLPPRASKVDFFNDSVAEGFVGRTVLSCNDPVVAVAVNQDFANGNFPTDRVTVKGQN